MQCVYSTNTICGKSKLLFRDNKSSLHLNQRTLMKVTSSYNHVFYFDLQNKNAVVSFGIASFCFLVDK